MKYYRFIKSFGGWPLFQELLQVLRVIADRHNDTGIDEHRYSITNVATRFILDQPAVAGVIVGVRLGESEHTEDNRRMFSLVLNARDQEEIRQVLCKANRIPGDCGDEYRKPPFLTASGDLSDHLDHPTGIPTNMYGLSRKPPRGGVSFGDPCDGCHVTSGSVWEEIAGFCRAIRRGKTIYISGTTATNGKQAVAAASAIHETDEDSDTRYGILAQAQTTFILDKIEAAIKLLGGTGLADVTRTRIFVPHVDRDWEPIAREHGYRFSEFPPANTLVGSALVGADYLVEIEAEAVICPK